MIVKDDMMSLILDACPSFASTWQAFLDDWREEINDLPLYIALNDLARHLIGLLERGETAELPAAFQAVERWHLEGNEYVREAATVGLLEDLQNLNLHTTTDPEQFRKYLGSTSERWWNKLYRLWEHGELLTDD